MYAYLLAAHHWTVQVEKISKRLIKKQEEEMPGFRLVICIWSMLLSFVVASSGFAKVTQEEAARLGKDLTPLGAIKSGNAEGTIPAWDGGMSVRPAGVPERKVGEPYADAFANDKILFTITAQNYKQYGDKISSGHQAMFEKYPDFKMNVYPTHRPVYYTDHLVNKVRTNAIQASLTPDGMGSQGEVGPVPFPIPKNGNEAILNPLTFIFLNASTVHARNPSFLVLPSGDIVSQGGANWYALFPNQVPESSGNHEFNRMALIEYIEPVRRKGEILLMLDPKNLAGEDLKIWQYLPGQRRVRRAPGLTYDTPDPSTGNLGTYDDSYMYWGKIDRYDWELKGRREMYIMYNDYRVHAGKRTEVLTPHFINPDFARWELHRVWEVEANLKEGKRHAYARRVFYIDEDSWSIVHTDRYDSHDKLWRFMDRSIYWAYDKLDILGGIWLYHDLTQDCYAANNCSVENDYGPARINPDEEIVEEMFTPEYLRRLGRR